MSNGAPAVIRNTVSLSNLALATNHLKPPYSLAKLRGRVKSLPTTGSVSMNSSKTFQNLFNPVFYLDANNYIAGSTTWTDTSGNSIDFTVETNVLTSNSAGIKAMNFSGGAGGARRLVNGNFSNVPYSSNATFIVFSTVLNDASTWRTLIRDADSNHTVIIQTGGSNLGGFFLSGGFVGNGVSITELPNPYSRYNMMVWKFSNSNPFHEFLFNELTSSYTTGNSNSAWTTSFSHIGCKYDTLTSASQYWGNIGLALYYNRYLGSNELSDIYTRFAPRFFDPTTCSPSILDGGNWSVVCETTTAKRNVSGNIPYSSNNIRLLSGIPFTRVAYYMQNRMLNGAITYWAFASMDAYSSTLSNYAFPDASNLITNQRNTSNMSVISNHPQVTCAGGLQGRLEMWPYDYSTNTTFGDGSSIVYDYDDTVTTTTVNQSSGYGCFQVHDITNRSTVFSWNAHLSTVPVEHGFGTNNTSNIHYFGPTNSHPDWTFSHNRTDGVGAYDFKCQVLINTTPIVTRNLTQFLYGGNTYSYPGSGTSWTDVSGNGTVTTTYNSPTFTTNYFTFNGTTQYALVPSVSDVTDFTTANNYSVGFWVWIASTQNDTASVDNDIVEKWDHAASAYPFVFRFMRSTSIMIFAIYNGSIVISLSTPNGSVPYNKWVHVTGTMSHTDKRMTLYLDGVRSAQTTGSGATITGTISNTIPINIMRRGGSGLNYTTGRFGIFYIYNRELSAHEVAQNHQATRILLM